MHLQIFLLFALFTAGHSLICNQCPGQSASTCDQIPCPSGFSNCFAATAYASALGVSSPLVTVKNCAPANGCSNGSVNLGNIKLSTYCCSTDLCTNKDAPDPSSNAPNGNTCYTCTDQDCKSIMACAGSENSCLKATWTLGGQTLGVKGCVTKSICDAASLIPNVQGVSCCQGNLCNGAKSVTQSFLFLCCSLISFILMH